MAQPFTFVRKQDRHVNAVQFQFNTDTTAITLPGWFIHLWLTGKLRKQDSKVFLREDSLQDVELSLGDWIVQDEKGYISRYTDSAFHANFELLRPSKPSAMNTLSTIQ